MLIDFNHLRIKCVRYARVACFSIAAYAVLNFAAPPQSSGQDSYPHFEALDTISGERQEGWYADSNRVDVSPDEDAEVSCVLSLR